MADVIEEIEDHKDDMVIFYFDTIENELNAVFMPRFGATWTNAKARHKIRDKKVQQAYVKAMKEIKDRGINGLVFYETLKMMFGMAPESKVLWTIDDLTQLIRLIENNNSYILVKNARVNDPELYKILSLVFEEGENLEFKTSDWTPEQVKLLQDIVARNFELNEAAAEEKLHHELLSKFRDSTISQIINE